MLSLLGYMKIPMTAVAKSLILLAGPNGAGKTTAAPGLLRETPGIVEYVNADTIAQGLAAFDPDRVAIAMGRIMMARIKQLAAARRRFAFRCTDME